ncbi:MAG: Lrp/AsnC ligand binding domain-containing protein [Thaumarchaeota archaeon]|nr:Lrp/AsnC ligand binding domain-containing protein [Nitrososphaerota archaeon]
MKELAEAAGVSIPTARSRILKLKDAGVIKRLTVDVDLRSVTNCVTAFITLKTRLPDVQAAVEKLKLLDEVSEAYVTTGQHDIVLKVHAPNMEALDQLVTKRLSVIDGVETASSSFVIETAKNLLGPVLRPGFGFKIRCEGCGDDIQNGGGLVKTVDGQERFFCNESCITNFARKS